MTWPWTSEPCQFFSESAVWSYSNPSSCHQLPYSRKLSDYGLLLINEWGRLQQCRRTFRRLNPLCPIVTSGDLGFCFLPFSWKVAIISWRDMIPGTSWDIDRWEAGEVHKTYQWSGLHLLILCRPKKQPGGRLKKEVQLCQPHLWPDDTKMTAVGTAAHPYWFTFKMLFWV